jgi:hypothetical protein
MLAVRRTVASATIRCRPRRAGFTGKNSNPREGARRSRARNGRAGRIVGGRGGADDGGDAEPEGHALPGVDALPAADGDDAVHRRRRTTQSTILCTISEHSPPNVATTGSMPAARRS